MRITNTLYVLLTSALAILLLAPNATISQSTNTIYDVVNNSPDHKLLSVFLQQSPDLVTILTFESVTLFAPNDTAFATLAAPYAYYLHPEWYLHLQFLLYYHIVKQALNKTQIFLMTELETFTSNATISVDRTNQTINGGSSILISDVVASNGYVQVPSRVLLPSSLEMRCNDILDALDGTYIYIQEMFRQAPAVGQTLNDDLEDGVTLFVTPNVGFTNLTESEYEDYFENGDNVIAGYLVAQKIIYPQTHLARPMAVTMYSDYTAWVYTAAPNNVTRINTATVTGTYLAANGVVNELDLFIRPLSLVDLFNLTTTVGALPLDRFVQMLKAAGFSTYFYENTTDAYTFLAPVDSAFDKVQALTTRLQEPQWSRHWHSLLLNHITDDVVKANNYISDKHSTGNTLLSNYSAQIDVAADGNITVNGVKALVSDLAATNGVIHALDKVLLPPSVTVPIYQQILGVSTLLALAENVASLNNSAGPLTVLVPSNDAFAKVGHLANFSTEEVRQIIENHIFAGNIIFINDLRHHNNNSAPISKIWNVTASVNGTYVGGALIVSSDNLASNGVYHVINRVLIGSVVATGRQPPTSSPLVTSSTSRRSKFFCRGCLGALLLWILSLT